MVANGQLETTKSTVELNFEIGDILFHETIIVMEKLTGPIIGLMFLQTNHTFLDIQQGIPTCLISLCKLKRLTPTSWSLYLTLGM